MIKRMIQAIYTMFCKSEDRLLNWLLLFIFIICYVVFMTNCAYSCDVFNTKEIGITINKLSSGIQYNNDYVDIDFKINKLLMKRKISNTLYLNSITKKNIGKDKWSTTLTLNYRW